MSEQSYKAAPPAAAIELAIIVPTEGIGAERVSEVKSIADLIEHALEGTRASIKVHEIRFSS